MRQKHPERFKEDLFYLFSLLQNREIKPVIGLTLPFIEAKKAHDLIESGSVEGKIVLLVGNEQNFKAPNSRKLADKTNKPTAFEPVE